MWFKRKSEECPVILLSKGKKGEIEGKPSVVVVDFVLTINAFTILWSVDSKVNHSIYKKCEIHSFIFI